MIVVVYYLFITRLNNPKQSKHPFLVMKLSDREGEIWEHKVTAQKRFVVSPKSQFPILSNPAPKINKIVVKGIVL